MTSLDPALLSTSAEGMPGDSTTASTDEVFAAMLDIASTLDATEAETRTLRAATRLLSADTISIWVPQGDAVVCPVAVGDDARALIGGRVPAASLESLLSGETAAAVMVAPLAPLAAGPANGGWLRASRGIEREGEPGGEFTPAERRLLARLAAAGGIALANARRVAAEDRTSDLALVTEMSRDITSTLDLDRVMRSVVNLAMKALSFDRGAVALYERGTCDIRAVAGAETVDPDDPELQDLAARSAWAAGIGQSFYLSDRTEPASDAERLFLQIFRDDLASDGVMSGLYIPLKDDEGVVGILVFEAARPDFATARQQELVTILANQATVAVRNARLYQQVPLADALGALQARKEAFFALPRQRRLAMAVAILVGIGVLTLIRWPLRVDGRSPSFRPTARADVRPLTDGIIERVLVREGATVTRGAPLLQLRDAELRGAYQAVMADADAAERSASRAADRGDAAEERLQRMRADVLRQQAAVHDERLRAATVRAPVAGVVLTARPEERAGSWVDAGSSVIVLGRTDTLELELGVDERDIGRVRVGEEVRLRVDAFPQRTFYGRVTSVSPIAVDTAGAAQFPVRAVVPNVDGALRPGMAAYARVLTDPASILGRAVREPARRLRLLWWRMWS